VLFACYVFFSASFGSAHSAISFTNKPGIVMVMGHAFAFIKCDALFVLHAQINLAHVYIHRDKNNWVLQVVRQTLACAEIDQLPQKEKFNRRENTQALSSPGAAEFEPVPIKQMNSLMSLVRCGVEKWPADSWH
jgi:hypothetical protein